MCVYDQNYALVIVTQQKRGIFNPIGQDKSVFIPHSNIKIKNLSETKQFWRTKFLDILGKC